MSTQLAISCPHCAATLKLKNNSFVGKKVPCPKCKKPFVVEQPPEDEFLADDDNDFGELESEEAVADEEFDAPRSKSKSKAESKTSKGKKKKSKSGGGFGPIAMIGGGVVLGLGLLGGLAYFAMSLFSGGSTNSWVKWLPENTDIAVQIRVADSLNAPFFTPITSHPTLSKLINQPPASPMGGSSAAITFFEGLGIQAKDVDTLTFGATDGMAMAQANERGPSRGPQQFVAVIRLKTPLDESKLAQAPTTVLAKEDYNGKSLYTIVGATSPKVSVHSVDATTILLGSDAELKAAIDGNGSAPAASRYAFADDKANFLFAAAPKDPEQLRSMGLSTFKALSSGKKEQSADVKGIYGNSYSITLNQNLVVNTRMSLDSGMAKATADQFKLDVEEFRTQLKASMTQMKSPNPFVSQAMIDKLVGHVDAMFASAQASENGSTANLTMTLSGQIIPDTLQMAEPFMPMLEQMAQQAQQAANSTAAKPKFGDKASDVLAYPGMVISAGEKSKTRIGDLGDKHNADIEAAMQEGTPAAPQPVAEGAAPAADAAAMAKPAAEVDPDAVPAANNAKMAKPEGEEDPDAAPAKPARKLSKQERKRLEELEEQGLADGNAAPASSPEMNEEPAEDEENAAMESEEDGEEEAIPENDDDIPEGLAGATMRLERHKAREAAAAKKAAKAAKKVTPDQGMDPIEASDGEPDDMPAKPAMDAAPGTATPDKSTQPKKSKKKSKDDDEEGDAPSSAETGGGPSMGLRLGGGDPDAAPAMKSSDLDDEADASDKAKPSDQPQKSRSRRRAAKKSED